VLVHVVDPNYGLRTVKADQIVVCDDNGTPLALSLAFGAGTKFLTADEQPEFNEALASLGLSPVTVQPVNLRRPT
jgi:hypothetical protein